MTDQSPKKSDPMTIVATVILNGQPVCIELCGDNCTIWHIGDTAATPYTIDEAIAEYPALESQLLSQGLIKRT